MLKEKEEEKENNPSDSKNTYDDVMKYFIRADHQSGMVKNSMLIACKELLPTNVVIRSTCFSLKGFRQDLWCYCNTYLSDVKVGSTSAFQTEKSVSSPA